MDRQKGLLYPGRLTALGKVAACLSVNPERTSQLIQVRMLSVEHSRLQDFAS
jgi:hypothetical protein